MSNDGGFTILNIRFKSWSTQLTTRNIPGIVDVLSTCFAPPNFSDCSLSFSGGIITSKSFIVNMLFYIFVSCLRMAISR